MTKIMKALSLILACVMLVSLICACAPNVNTDTTAKESETINVQTETNAPQTETETTAAQTEETTTEAVTTEPETTAPVYVEKVSKLGDYTVRYTDDSFDEDNITLQFGALSDIHQNGSANSQYYKKYVSALKQLKNISGGNLDAVAFAGDLTDGATRAQWQQVISGYLEVLDPEETYFMYCMGNHDSNHQYTSNFEYFQNLLEHSGKNFFAALQEDTPEDMYKIANYHYNVNGYDFFSVTVEYFSVGANCQISANTISWLDEQLKAVTEAKPNQPVFIIIHCMIYNTVYGSTLDTSTGSTSLGWYTSQLTRTLKKYPQVVTFSGHLHFPLNDERSIMQTDFTSLGCGSVRYMAIENGGYEDMKSATVMNDCEEFSQGLFVQVDANGAMRIVRMDFYHNETIRTAWVIPATRPDGSHLTKYTKDRDDKTAPEFSGDAEIILRKVTASAVQTTLKYKSAADADIVHHYQIYVFDSKGKTVQSYKIISDFYRHATVEDMNEYWTKELRGLNFDTEYTIEVYAYDSWDNQSTPLRIVVTTSENEPNYQYLVYVGDVEIKQD